jgi:hypothetical protein
MKLCAAPIAWSRARVPIDERLELLGPGVAAGGAQHRDQHLRVVLQPVLELVQQRVLFRQHLLELGLDAATIAHLVVELAHLLPEHRELLHALAPVGQQDAGGMAVGGGREPHALALPFLRLAASGTDRERSGQRPGRARAAAEIGAQGLRLRAHEIQKVAARRVVAEQRLRRRIGELDTATRIQDEGRILDRLEQPREGVRLSHRRA